LGGDGPDKLADFVRKSRGDSEDFQFVNSMGASAKLDEKAIELAESQEMRIQNRFSRAPDQTMIQDYDYFDGPDSTDKNQNRNLEMTRSKSI